MAEDDEVINLQLVMPEAVRAGVWANFAVVAHSPFEFTIDFARLEFMGERPTGGVVVQRVSLSPLFVRQLIDALETNWQKYAEKALPEEVRNHDGDD